MNQKEMRDKLKKEDIFKFLDDYYTSIGRKDPPQFRTYSLGDLKKCLVLYNIQLIEEEDKKSNDK